MYSGRRVISVPAFNWPSLDEIPKSSGDLEAEKARFDAIQAEVEDLRRENRDMKAVLAEYKELRLDVNALRKQRGGSAPP